MKLLAIAVFSSVFALSLPAAQTQPASSFKTAKYQKHKFKKPGKYHAPKIKGKKWKASKSKHRPA